MLDVESVRAIMSQAVPFNRALGVRVEQVTAESAVVVMPESAERHNHVGTVHAAAQFGLGEATAGALVIAAFGDLQAEGAVPLAAQATIAYRKPARGDLHGTATLTTAEQERVRADLAANGKARFTIPVQLTDADGQVTTDLTVEWVLLARR